MSTLADIRTKVRRLTRTPSTAQLSVVQLDDYINTFVLYDFPEHLRLFTLRETLTFYTIPFVDTYPTLAVPATDPLSNFANRYITIHPPVYIGGRLSTLYQDREGFFSRFPLNQTEETVGNGDGVVTAFAGTLNATAIPFLPGTVTIGSVDANGNALTLRDVQTGPRVGNLIIPDDATVVAGTINYVTGVFTFDFNLVGYAPPANGEDVIIAQRPYQEAWPHSILYFNNIFTLRPVPDKVYSVDVEMYLRPTELLTAGQSPELEQWWQYIAYGSAKKIFEDRMDMQSVQMIMAEFKQQERLVLRRTIVQQTNERVATIYTEQGDFNSDDNSSGSF